MKYVYGKSFSRMFYAVQDGFPLALPSQTPAIYVFRNYPSVSDAKNGTGSVATASAWTQSSTSPYGNTYIVPAIDNPDTTNLLPPEWTYYEAINFVTTSSGQTQTIIRSFELQIPENFDSLPGTTYTDLQNVYPSITSYFTAGQLTTFITDAETELKIELEGKGLKYWQHRDLFKVKLALAYKAIANACLANFKDVGDRFYKRYEVYAEKYSALMAQIDLPVDVNKDGVNDGAVQAKPSFVFVRR
jgi:hypothetical protein